MTTECCWPFCGGDPKECDCADNAKREVMPNDAGQFPVPRPVAPPPVSEAGGDLFAAIADAVTGPSGTGIFLVSDQGVKHIPEAEWRGGK